jgi:hypothetical protein
MDNMLSKKLALEKIVPGRVELGIAMVILATFCHENKLTIFNYTTF